VLGGNEAMRRTHPRTSRPSQRHWNVWPSAPSRWCCFAYAITFAGSPPSRPREDVV